ncbi:MAG: calcium/sodium antiporter [Prevotella sp.]|nr:calcium/sodium antiporter [Prevotella sp.]
MVIDIVLIVVGIVLVLWGADRLTDGAVAVAQRLRIPEMVIGLTIVGLGTSMPELCISLVSALKGTSDLAVGNVVGSNIFNTLLIVGVAAMVAPITILRSTVWKDMPWSMLAGVLLAVLCFDGCVSRLDALILFAIFLIFMGYTLYQAKKGKAEMSAEEARSARTPLAAAGLIILGLACLVVGSNVFVDAATRVARALNVSDAVIGLTIVAGGTSLPELATSVVAARKGQSAIAIGNVIGSNVFNVLLIIGLTGLICPMELQGITLIDYAVMTLGMAMLWCFSYTRLLVERWEGAALTAVFATYLAWLLYNAVAMAPVAAA